MRQPYYGHLENDTKENANFRKVIFTGQYLQLVLMSLKPGEDIGMEVHDTVDQFFRFDQGEGKVVIEGAEFDVTDGDSVVIPAGSNHNIINTGSGDLKLYTVYTPPNHPDGTIHKTKQEADAAELENHH
jgi:mannose-6-phosphate isomerase-like protein (cupin superfamily)